MSASEATSPSTALTMGTSIAVAVPKANSRITTAAARPIASLLSVVRLRHRLTEVSTGGDSEAGVACRARRVDDRLGVLLREVARALRSSVTEM